MRVRPDSTNKLDHISTIDAVLWSFETNLAVLRYVDDGGGRSQSVTEYLPKQTGVKHTLEGMTWNIASIRRLLIYNLWNTQASRNGDNRVRGGVAAP